MRSLFTECLPPEKDFDMKFGIDVGNGTGEKKYLINSTN